MSTEDNNNKVGSKTSLSRRHLLGSTAALAAVGSAAGGLTLSRDAGVVTPAAAQAKGGQKYEVKPGELDEYYVFFSSGQTGELRIMGLPSMRELMRVPVFNRCSATGWGLTNESKKVLTEGMRPEYLEMMKERGGLYTNGDLHHPHLSFTDGTYDGRYLFANDKSNSRVCRIRLDVMRCDKIIQLAQSIDGARSACAEIPKNGVCVLQWRGPGASSQ